MTNFENFFFSKIIAETDIDNCYFCLPNNNCLTYFLNELIIILKNQEKDLIKNNYLIEISKAFYKFLDADKILKNINSLAYASLYLLIKSISEGHCEIKKSLVLDNLISFKRLWCEKYYEKIVKEILAISKEEKFDMDDASYFGELFLNEILARGMDIRFIRDSASWYTEGKCFKSFEDYFIFFNEKTTKSTDIFLPIKNCNDKNRETIENAGQRVSEIDRALYLVVYDNDRNDYFSIVKNNMTRIDSIFNLLKLYTASKVDFDYESEIIIKIKNNSLINKSLEKHIKFSDIVTYRGVVLYQRYFNNTVANLKTIYDKDINLYHKTLNIVGYAEKDNDFISSSSFVDAWIALESLYSLSRVYDGYDAVKNLLPKYLSSKFIVSKITFLLMNSFTKTKVKMEVFIEKACNGEKLKMTSSNQYYCHELNKLYKCVSNLGELEKLYDQVECDLRLSLLRIYMLRNQYVHESKLSAFTSLDFYRLKNLLTLSIDIFVSMIDRKIRYIDSYDDFAFTLFSSLTRKNNSREMLFRILKENIKCNKGGERLTIKELDGSLPLNELILNILLNNNQLVEKFKKYDNG